MQPSLCGHRCLTEGRCHVPRDCRPHKLHVVHSSPLTKLGARREMSPAPPTFPLARRPHSSVPSKTVLFIKKISSTRTFSFPWNGYGPRVVKPFFKNKFIYFIFGCIGSSLQCTGFLWWWLLLWSTGSRHVGFSSHGSRALEHRPSSCGTWA